MKVKTLVVIILLYTNPIYSQDGTKTEDFKIPSTPGFALLDLSPSTIQRPSSSKALALTLLNAVGNGNVFPKDFALEVTPYWLVKLKGETFYKYLSLYDGDSHNSFSGILRKFSFSLSTHFNDSGKNFLPKTNYVSLGLKTNIVTLWGKGETEKMKQYLNEFKSIAADVALLNLSPGQSADSVAAREKRKAQEIGYKFKDLRPLFRLDIAYATASMFADNKYENRKFYKQAAWLNASFSIPVSKDYIHAIAYARFGEENVLMDTPKMVFSRNSTVDFGIKAEYEKGKFSIAIEHIYRKYKDNNILNGNRTVGIIQYKVDDNFTLFGTYGKNFSNLNNLFTLFGINWAFGDKNLLANPK